MTYSLFEGMGGGDVEPERRLERQQFTKTSLLTLINTCSKVPLQVNFLDDDIFLCVHSWLVFDTIFQHSVYVIGNNGLKLEHLYCLYSVHTAKKIPFLYSFSGNCAVSVPKKCPHSERFIHCQDRSTYFLQQNRQIDRGNIYIAHRHMNV